MLVLNRKIDEVVVVEIAGKILEITLLSVGRERIAIGFEGPADFKILRKELLRGSLRRNSLT